MLYHKRHSATQTPCVIRKAIKQNWLNWMPPTTLPIYTGRHWLTHFSCTSLSSCYVLLTLKASCIIKMLDYLLSRFFASLDCIALQASSLFLNCSLTVYSMGSNPILSYSHRDHSQILNHGINGRNSPTKQKHNTELKLENIGETHYTDKHDGAARIAAI